MQSVLLNVLDGYTVHPSGWVICRSLNSAIAAAFAAAQKHPSPGPLFRVEPSSRMVDGRGKVDSRPGLDYFTDLVRSSPSCWSLDVCDGVGGCLVRLELVGVGGSCGGC